MLFFKLSFYASGIKNAISEVAIYFIVKKD